MNSVVFVGSGVFFCHYPDVVCSIHLMLFDIPLLLLFKKLFVLEMPKTFWRIIKADFQNMTKDHPCTKKIEIFTFVL